MFRDIQRRRIELDYFITPDGKRLDLHNGADMFLLDLSGTGMPPIQYIESRGPFQHGTTIIDYRLDPRVMQLILRGEACDRYDYWDLRANLLNYLRPNRQTTPGVLCPGVLRKILPGGATRDIDVFIQQGPAFTASVGDTRAVTEAILFVAPDPSFYDPVIVTNIWYIGVQNNLIFPFTFPFTLGDTTIFSQQVINYTGTWLAYPTITITGPILSPEIRNDTTGESIRLGYTVVAGETLTIILKFGAKSVTSNPSGNAIAYASGDIATFHIAPDPEAPGGVNNITVIGSGAVVGVTAVTVSYYTRYIGY